MKYIGSNIIRISNARILDQISYPSSLDALSDVRFYKRDLADQANSSALEKLLLDSELKLVNLVDLDNIPFWLFDRSVSSDYLVYTTDPSTEGFFSAVLQASIISSKSATLLLETVKSVREGRYVLVYPVINSEERVEINTALLSFRNSVAVELNKVRNLMLAQKLELGDPESQKTLFLELDEQEKKEDNFFDTYLRKRSLSRQKSFQKPTTASNDGTDPQEVFVGLLDKCILSEFRMRSVGKKISKSEYKELYGLISRSTKFILRDKLRKNEVPAVDEMADIVSELCNVLGG
ncbi:DEKNAAC102366 [Brettanomyces naardenensis]|uniref:DEKNAAC102366 n=1 Tax=Brettanomyces naardenensis TaxID=13370 RepID=A0A448YKZ7_BRENA|nr:DEKNAAC102366 [Brettanomyces naardenensis]